MVEIVPVAEAARLLDVSPRRVRDLLESGSLSGRRIGGRWLVDPDSLRFRLSSPRSSGRPLSKAGAWDLLWLLATAGTDEAHGQLVRLLDVKHVMPAHRASRARQRARRLLARPIGCQELVAMLRGRCDRSWWFAHPIVLADIRLHRGATVGGVTAAEHWNADLLDLSSAELYVDEALVAELADRFGLLPCPAPEANVLLRAVPRVAAGWLLGLPAAPVIVVALDLLERDGSRERTAGEGLLRQVLQP